MYPAGVTDAAGLVEHYRRLHKQMLAPRPIPPSKKPAARIIDVAARKRAFQDRRATEAEVLWARVKAEAQADFDRARIKPSGKALAAEFAAYHGITFAQLIGTRRNDPLVKVRQGAMAFVREQCPTLTMPQIGGIFCRDHTTVLHALRAVAKRIEAAQ